MHGTLHAGRRCILLSRYAHYLAGVTWIGLLYYFNFVQMPDVRDVRRSRPAPKRSAKLVPRALWWFRWAAVLTVALRILRSSASKNSSTATT